MAEQHDVTKLPNNAKRVLHILQEADRPLTAYEVLDRLRPFGVTAPPTAYRSLERLIETGLAHRLESLNAFVACRQGGAHGPSAFAVCSDCKQVTEMRNDAMPGYIYGWADAADFEVKSVMIEALGYCADCRRKHAQDAPSGHA